MIIPEGEQAVRIDTDLKHPFRPFLDIARKTGRTIAREFKGLNHNADLMNPPILIYSDQYMTEAVRPMVLESYRDVFGKFAYFPNNHIIMASDEAVQAQLDRGSEGLRKLALIMAEEEIHAQTTVVKGADLSIGYALFPQVQKKTTLQPGAIYDATAVKVPEVVRYTSHEGESHQIDMVLTERVTQLVIHAMIEKVLPDLKRKYPVVLIHQDGKRPVRFQGKERLLKTCLESLYKGDASLLTKNGMPPELMSLLIDENPIYIGALPSRDCSVDEVIGRSA